MSRHRGGTSKHRLSLYSAYNVLWLYSFRFQFDWRVFLKRIDLMVYNKLTVFNTMCWQWILFETHCRQAYSYYSAACGPVRYEPVISGGARDRSRARHQSLVSARFAHVRLVRQLRSRAHASRRRHRCHSLSLWSVYIRPLNNVLLPSNSLHNRWRRSLVKLVGRDPGQSGQAIKLFQTPRQIGSIFHFWQKSFILLVAELFNNSFEWKNVTL